MIKIGIVVKDGKVYDEFAVENHTLSENALAVRHLEKFKLDLLDREFDSDFEVQEVDDGK